MSKTYMIRSAALAILVNAAFLLAVWHSLQPPIQCSTDAECMQRYGGNGDPD